MRLRVLGGRRKTAALAESNLSPQQALTSTLTPPQPSWLSSQCRLQLLSPALQQSPVKPASSLEVSSRKWGPSPLWRDADLQCWRCPGLPSLSKSSFQLGPCLILICPSSLPGCSAPGPGPLWLLAVAQSPAACWGWGPGRGQ